MEDPDGKPIAFDYFVCVRRGNKIYDPLSKELFEEYEKVLFDKNDADSCERFEHDSEDSNRESAEQNDYPDEEFEDFEKSQNSSNSNKSRQDSSYENGGS